MKQPILNMQPGPTIVDDRVIQSLVHPVMHHLSPEFIEILEETCTHMQQVYETDGEIVILPSSGRGAVEAVLASVRETDRPLIVPVNGFFSNMMVNIGRALGMEVVALRYESGQVLPREEILAEVARHNQPILGMVHNDTSTSMVNDLSGYAEAVHDAGGLFLVDAVSSLGGTAVQVDAHGIDFCASASQKALGAIPGVATVSVSTRGREALDARSDLPRGNYFDLRKWWDLWVLPERGGRLASGYRRLPWSMPTHLIVALHRACELMLEEGLEARYERHARAARALRAGVEALGLEAIVAEEAASSTLTAVASAGVDLGATKQRIAERHGIRVAGSMEGPSVPLIRIAHMAETARLGPLVRTLSAIAEDLAENGDVRADAVAAFYRVWDAAD